MLSTAKIVSDATRIGKKNYEKKPSEMWPNLQDSGTIKYNGEDRVQTVSTWLGNLYGREFNTVKQFHSYMAYRLARPLIYYRFGLF